MGRFDSHLWQFGQSAIVMYKSVDISRSVLQSVAKLLAALVLFCGVFLCIVIFSLLCLYWYNIRFLLRTRPVGVGIAISVSLCQSAHLRISKTTSEFHKIFCTHYTCPWFGFYFIYDTIR